MGEFSSGDDSSCSSSCSPWSSLPDFSDSSSNEEEDELEMIPHYKQNGCFLEDCKNDLLFSCVGQDDGIKEITFDGVDFSRPRNPDQLIDNFDNNSFGRPDHLSYDISSNGSLVISAEPLL